MGTFAAKGYFCRAIKEMLMVGITIPPSNNVASNGLSNLGIYNFKNTVASNTASSTGLQLPFDHGTVLSGQEHKRESIKLKKIKIQNIFISQIMKLNSAQYNTKLKNLIINKEVGTYVQEKQD